MRRDIQWLAALGLAAPIGLAALPVGIARAQSVDDLQRMSLDELASINVSSVTKTPESLGDAPAAIYVISHEDIVRSGAGSIPEILRLAPNLQVAETSAAHYVITARGFSGNANAQSFSDKLLVLIDGRSVYTPLFSGVYWDMQDVLPEDIERIEVISGPGATLWGANAVNGVINIITRKAAQTQGGVADVSAGSQMRSLSLQYGGRIGDNVAYRLYAKDFQDDDTKTSTGAAAHDNWSKPQVGFRLDWTPNSADALTLQGDAYRGIEAQAGAPAEMIVGRNLFARWTRAGQDGSSLQVQAYYDRTERATDGVGGGRFALNTYDLDVQHNFALGSRNQVVWGAGVRINQYTIDNTASLLFAPSARTLDLSNVFIQDSFSITKAAKLILGLKLEDDPYSGVTALPSLRMSWNVTPTTLVWTAVSRAVRSATPFDRDVVEKIGPTVFLTGGQNFTTEKLTAYEAGLRVQPTQQLSLSVSVYYNVYDDLRSIEPNPVSFLPLSWGNAMRGSTQGLEAWGEYRVAPWWRLSAGLNLLSEHLKFLPGDAAILGVSQAGDDPKTQASLKSSMNLGRAVTLDADLRYVGALPDPRVPSYVELGGRIAWNVSSRVQLSLTGANLLHDHHQEFRGPQANEAVRNVAAEARLRF
jgi:iron complex outermembrane receptor protein